MIPSLDMIQQYAPDVAPQTIAAIIRVESGGNQFALGVNGRSKPRRRPRCAQEAIAAAQCFIAKGYSVDLGLMQINSRNLRGLGLTIEQAFDPRLNIQAGATILSRGYRGAVKRYGQGQAALRAALSAYNTGNYEMGFRNGYVAKYYPDATGSFMPVASRRSTQASAASLGSIDSPVVSMGGVRLLAKAVNPYKAELSVYRPSEVSRPFAGEEISPLKLASAQNQE